MKKIIFIGILGCAVLFGGCATMQVKDTEGVKAMLNTRVTSVSMKKNVTAGKPTNQAELIKLYEEAKDLNNGWIEGIKFDLQAKPVFDVNKRAYTEELAALSAANFIISAQSSLNIQQLGKSTTSPPQISPKEKLAEFEPSLLTLKEAAATIAMGKSIGIEAAVFVNEIINNIIKQDKVKAEEARKRIYQELEKSKWPD